MSWTVDFDNSREAMSALVQWAIQNDAERTRNEAATRLHLIDRLLLECLAWGLEATSPEDRLDGKYADYVLGSPAKKLVVEAKRESIYFELPAGMRAGTHKVRTLFESGQGVQEAIRQSVSYAQERGTPFAAVANGHQLIALVASRQDGVSPFDGYALAFPTLEEMEANFRLLWDNLSAPGVELLTLHKTVRVDDLPKPPRKLSETISGFPGYRNRNSIQNSLQTLGELFLQDLVSSEELAEDFLEETYCTSGALSQHALVSTEILRTRYSALFKEENQISSEPLTDKDGEIAESVRSDLLASGLGRRPIVLLGDVGVGKTMFIKHLIHVDAKDVLAERSLVIYIDFGSEPAITAHLGAHVYRSIVRQLVDKYSIDIESEDFVRAAYHGELKRFDSGIYGALKSIDRPAYERQRIEFLAEKLRDTDGHLAASLQHLAKGQQRQIVIFLDNIDQRPTAFQEEVFLISQGMAAQLPATVFISLRPSTFFASKETGSLSAYQPRVFTIAPPRVEIVVKKRISYALKILREEHRLDWFPEGVTLEAENLEAYLKALLDSFERNDELVEFLDNASSGNVRRALDYVGTFVGSGHVDTEKILEVIRHSGSYLVPVHEFMRAVIYGENRYFDPASTPVANLFGVSSNDGREHFLLPVVLTELQVRSTQRDTEGFVSVDEVYSSAQKLGFTPPQIRQALERSEEKRLLETRLSSAGGAEASLRITPLGAYSVERLIKLFAYVDAVITDTPVTDAAYRSNIGVVHSIADRVQRAEWFRNYLDKAWNGLGDHNPSFEWPQVSAELRKDIWDVGRRVDPQKWPA